MLGKYPISACQQKIMRAICGSESGENWGEKQRKMPVLGCKETLGAWFSLGIHVSLSRPGLAGLTVRRKISLAGGIHRYPEFFLFLWPNQGLHILKNMRIHTHIRLRRDYMNYLWYQITLRTQTGGGEKFRLDIYHWGAGLAVTG